MKKIIGLAPSTNYGEEISCMSDTYKVGNNYAKRVLEQGCTPIGLAPIDNVLPDSALDLCDGFVVQGGKDFYYYHFQVIHHAVENNKKYLGICMGNQLIYAYFKLKSMVVERGYTGDIVTAIYDLFKQPGVEDLLLEKVEGHSAEFPPRGVEDIAKHNVKVEKDTILYNLLGTSDMRICTFHNYATPREQTLLKVNAWSSEGVVEGVEYGDYILGVQGHPEADRLLNKIFEFIAK